MAKHSEDYYLRRLPEKTQIKDVMTSPALKISEESSLSEAQQIFQTNKVTHLLVVDEKNSLVGFLSPKFVYKTHSPMKILSDNVLYNPRTIVDGDSYYDKDILDSYRISSVMMRDPFTTAADELVSDAIKEMDKRNISCIPIVDENKKVQGILTNQEIVNFVARLLNE